MGYMGGLHNIIYPEPYSIYLRGAIIGQGLASGALGLRPRGASAQRAPSHIQPHEKLHVSLELNMLAVFGVVGEVFLYL